MTWAAIGILRGMRVRRRRSVKNSHARAAHKQRALVQDRASSFMYPRRVASSVCTDIPRRHGHGAGCERSCSQRAAYMTSTWASERKKELSVGARKIISSIQLISVRMAGCRKACSMLSVIAHGPDDLINERVKKETLARLLTDRQQDRSGQRMVVLRPGMT